MQKKRSVEVIVIATLMLIFGLLSFFILPYLFIDTEFIWHPLSRVLTITLPVILIPISGFIYIICGIFLLRVSNWSRKVSICYSSILVMYSIPFVLFFLGSALYTCYKEETSSIWWKYPFYFKMFVASLGLLFVILPLIFIFYLTRSKVKEQFK